MNSHPLSDIDEKITKAFLRSSSVKKNHFMHNVEKSYHVFFKDLSSILNVNNYLLYEKNNFTNKEIYELNINLREFRYPEKTYQDCYHNGDSYDGTIIINIKIIKKTINNNKTNELKIFEGDMNMKLPIFIASNGYPIINSTHDFLDDYSTGGYFIMDNNVTRTIIFLEDNTTSWVKNKAQKGTNTNHYSTYFHSSPLIFVNEVKFDNPQYIKIKCNILGNNQCFDMSSKNNLPNPINILILASYLTNFNLSTIKEFIMSIFSNRKDEDSIEIYDNDVFDIINQLFFITYAHLDNTNHESFAIHDYIMTNFNYNLEDDKDKLNLDTIIDGLFPFINSIYYIMKERNEIFLHNLTKGHLLILLIVQTIMSNFQKNIYPSNDNIANKRIITPGLSFEKILYDELKKFHKELSNEFQKNEQNTNVGSVASKTFRPNTFSKNMINKNSKGFSAVKPTGKAYSNLSLINVNNQLTKNLGPNDKQNRNLTRDPSLSLIVGSSATPDSQNVGQINSILSNVIINTMTHEEQKNLIYQIISFLKTDKDFIPIHVKDVFKNNVVMITFSIDNIMPVGYVLQSKARSLHRRLLEAKRTFIFDTPFIDIALFPCHIKQIGNFEPIVDKFVFLKITLGHKIPFIPCYVVTNGVPNIMTVNPNDRMLNLPFDEILKINTNIFEYLGPEQIQTSQVISSMTEFQERTKDIQQKIEYISLEDDLKLSILESSHLALTISNGARPIFAFNQAKSNISMPRSSNLENLETTKFTINSSQISPLTTPILQYNNQGEQQISMIIGMAHLAYDNNEDAVTVTDVFSRYCVYIKIIQYVLKDNLKSTKSDSILDNDDAVYPEFNYDINGIIRKNAPIEPNDELNINTKLYYSQQLGNFKKINSSNIYDYTKPGRVDDIKNRSSHTNIMIHVRNNTAIGDKFSDRNAQKYTIGKIIPRKHAPYDINNNVPLIIFNSYSIEARQTENKRLTSMMLNVAMSCGLKINFKSFTKYSFLDYIKFIKNNYRDLYPLASEEQINDLVFGNVWMYNPETCERIIMKVPFMFDFTSKLIQTSRDTITSRGEIEKNFNDQEKGQKHGTMEMVCHLATGTCYIIQEIFMGNIFFQTNFILCMNCMQPATYITLKNGTTYYDCINCSANNFVPRLQKFLLNPQTVKILQAMPVFGAMLKIREDDDFYLFKE